MHDARVNAFLGASEAMKVAEQIRHDVGKASQVHGEEIPVPDVYWMFLAEANVYAQLANAPRGVGVDTADVLRARAEDERRIANAEARAEKLFDDSVKHAEEVRNA